MATNEQIFVTKVLLNSEQAKNEISALQKKVEDLRKKRDDAWKAGDTKGWEKLGREIDKTEKKVRQMEGGMKNVNRTLDNMSMAGPKQLRDTIRQINNLLNDGSVERGSQQWDALNATLRDANAELKKIKEEGAAAEGIIGTGKRIFGAYSIAKDAIGLLYDKIGPTIEQSIELAEAAEGVGLAFARLDRPDLLEGLRQATHGTVSDLELMKQAVKFQDFNLPVEQLGKYLAFAQQKAKDTGESIDYLVTSIVNGLGRQSKPILDNLGLSAKEIEAEVGKTGDFVTAVTNILERNMAQAGDYVETAADRAARANAKLQNAQLELGRQLLPLKEQAAALFATLQQGFVQSLGFLIENRKAVYTIAAAVTAYTAVVYAHTIAVKAQAAATTIAAAAQRALNLAMRANPWGLAAAAIAAVVTAIIAFVGRTREATNATQQNTEAMRRQEQQLRNIKQIEEQANRTASERVTKINLLRKTVEDSNEAYSKRKTALEELRRIVPEYHGHLSKEKGLYDSNTGAIDAYIKKIQDAAIAQAAMSKMTEINNRIMDADIKIASKEQEIIRQEQRMADERMKLIGETDEAKIASAQLAERVSKGAVDMIGQEIEGIKKAKTEAEAEMNAITSYLKNKGIDPNATMPATGDGNYQTDADDVKAERDRLKRAADAAKAEADAKMAAKTHEYAMGKIAYRQYVQDMAALQMEGLQRQRDVYQQGSAEYEKLNRQIEELTLKGTREQNQLRLEELERDRIRMQAAIEAQAQREEITEQQKQEALRMLEETYLADKVNLYREGSKERMDAEWQLEQTETRNRLERERQYQQQLDQVRQQYLGMSNDRQLQTALSGLDRLHELGLIKEEEYQRARIAIQAQYGRQNPTPSEQTAKTASDMLTNARNAAQPASTAPIVGTVEQYATTMEKLKELYGNDEQNHAAYLMAKQQATSQFCQQLASEFQAAYDSVNQILSAASSYFSAEQEYETAQVKKKYEKQIAAAGNNQAKVKKLQEQQQKEEAAIKTKYNNKALKIQIAQALATTAMNALKAYGSVIEIPVVGPTLAPIAAAAAIAAGMLQVAALKKQQAAQQAGYYEGGFTGGRRYRREAGVVHEGEFVANHQAVSNPNIVPFLNFLDQAQRNNTVGSLTMQDVSRSMGADGAGQVVAPIVNVQTDNEELREAVRAHREATEALLDRLDYPIEARMDMQQFDRDYRHYKKLNS